MAMQHLEIPAGTTVYSEGEPGNNVYVVDEGEIEVLRDVDGRVLRLAVLGRGEIFGEMSVLNGQKRSTTTRALRDSVLIPIPGDAFLAAFGKDNPLALAMLRMLSNRLAKADRKLAATHFFQAPARVEQVASIRILPGSHAVEGQIGEDGVSVESLPYTVGRRAMLGDAPIVGSAELSLQTLEQYHLAPQHFTIEDRDGDLVLRDLGTHTGTVVNDTRIATFEPSDTAALHVGENVVRPGGLETPYTFRILVASKD